MLRLVKNIKNKKEKKEFEFYKTKLIKEIHKTVKKIYQTELWFQMESDKNLIDSCIYQRELLYSRYRHLIEKAKFSKIEINPQYLIKSLKENE